MVRDLIVLSAATNSGRSGQFSLLMSHLTFHTCAAADVCWNTTLRQLFLSMTPTVVGESVDRGMEWNSTFAMRLNSAGETPWLRTVRKGDVTWIAWNECHVRCHFNRMTWESEDNCFSWTFYLWAHKGCSISDVSLVLWCVSFVRGWTHGHQESWNGNSHWHFSWNRNAHTLHDNQPVSLALKYGTPERLGSIVHNTWLEWMVRTARNGFIQLEISARITGFCSPIRYHSTRTWQPFIVVGRCGNDSFCTIGIGSQSWCSPSASWSR
jgi:hypothetical protein